MSGTLVHGTLDQSGGAIVGADGTAINATIETYVEGLDLGAPDPLIEALPRMLLDGEDITGDRSSNRTIAYTLEVKGATKGDVDAVESRLIAEINAPRNSYKWKPDPAGPTTVFETFRGRLKQRFDTGWDKREANHLRLYDVELAALPFGRALDRTVVEGLIVNPTTTSTVIDACDVATGWSCGSRTVSVSTAAYTTATGAIGSTSESDGAYTKIFNTDAHTITGIYHTTYAKTFAAVSMTGTKYLSFWVAGYTTTTATCTVDGATCTPRGSFSEKGASGAYGVRFVFECPSASWTAFVADVNSTEVFPWNTPPLRMGIVLDDLRKSNQPPAASTGYQGVWSIPIDGSMRTPGSLQIAHDTDALGDVLVLTYDDLENGYRPDQRRNRVSGQTVTFSGGVVSGGSELLTSVSNSFTARIPVNTLAPGTYMLIARTRRSANGTEVFTATAGTYFGSTLVGSLATITPSVAYAVSGTYQVDTLGRFTLPTRRTRAGSAAEVEIKLMCGAGTVTLDELWVVPLDGVTTRVPCGSSTPAAGASSSKLFIDSPTISDLYGGIWVGTAADGSDARSAGPDLGALGRHIFKPPKTVVFVVTTNAKGPTVSLSYHARSHTNMRA